MAGTESRGAAAAARVVAFAAVWLAGSPPAAALPDPHSHADPGQIVVRHVALDLEADFRAQRLHGAVELTVERVAADADVVVLDTRELEIRRVALRNEAGGLEPLEHRFGPSDPMLGRALEIRMPAAASPAAREVVRIEYATTPAATALQWLEPRQTRGRVRPFLYTQSQTIHARSWIPVQDSPGIRFTYEARIRAPADLRVVMSAAAGPRSPVAGEHRFEMPQPVPAYLVALAIGDLEFRELGPRTGVFAEPAILAAAAHEFADLEAMLAVAEQQFGPYRWDRYDLLIMPPSFPFGGMENPRLSFISPTIIAGDRSLVSLITHEMAHSWSGNLATNAGWGDFWLNEGITTYLERRILEAAYGPRLAALELVLGRQYLDQEIADLAAEGRLADSALELDLRGRDPDDALTDIAYEKGSLFLQFLEWRFGRAALDEFLRGYFRDFSFRTVTTEEFKAYLRAHLLSRRPGVVGDAELQQWLHGTGLPPGVPPIHDATLAAVDRLRDDWLAGQLATAELPVQSWRPQEWMRFLDTLPGDLPDDRLAELDALGSLSKAGNYEVSRSWLLLAVRSDYRPADARLEAFLVGTGRHKMVKRLYEELARTAGRRELGCRIYSLARPGYHPTTRLMIDGLLTDCEPT